MVAVHECGHRAQTAGRVMPALTALDRALASGPSPDSRPTATPSPKKSPTAREGGNTRPRSRPSYGAPRASFANAVDSGNSDHFGRRCLGAGGVVKPEVTGAQRGAIEAEEAPALEHAVDDRVGEVGVVEYLAPGRERLP
jgi:hypothetical protein